MDNYDDEWAAQYQRLAMASIPGREGLYRLCAAHLSGLPEGARILVVGCGTGEELITLAGALPHAIFDALDPSESMMAICSRRVAEADLSERVTLHALTLDDFTSPPVFDAATSILVSQHIESDALAQAFFDRIAACLKPGGLLYSADLHIGAGQDRESVFGLWHRNLVVAGIEPTMADGMVQKVRSDMHTREEASITGFLERAGFERILMPFRSLMYGTWAASRSA